MVSPLSITMTGTRAVERYLNEEKQLIEQAANKSISEATLFTEGEVKQSIAGHRAETTSVDTGRLLGSVTAKSKQGVGVVFSRVKYAPYIEYGTSKVPARAHFKNSLARNRQKIVGIISQGIYDRRKVGIGGLRTSFYK